MDSCNCSYLAAPVWYPFSWLFAFLLFLAAAFRCSYAFSSCACSLRWCLRRRLSERVCALCRRGVCLDLRLNSYGVSWWLVIRSTFYTTPPRQSSSADGAYVLSGCRADFAWRPLSRTREGFWGNGWIIDWTVGWLVGWGFNVMEWIDMLSLNLACIPVYMCPLTFVRRQLCPALTLKILRQLRFCISYVNEDGSKISSGKCYLITLLTTTQVRVPGTLW